MIVGVQKDQVLREELGIDQPAADMLGVPDRVFVAMGVARAMFLRDANPHVGDVGEQLFRVALPPDRFPDDLHDLLAQVRVAGDDACAGQGHLFPRPGLFLLVGDEGVEA